MQGAKAIPLQAPYREVGRVTQGRAEGISTDHATGIVLVAVGTGKVQLTTLGIEVMLATLVHGECARIIRNLDVELLAVGGGRHVGRNVCDGTLLPVQWLFTVLYPALVDLTLEGFDLASC